MSFAEDGKYELHASLQKPAVDKDDTAKDTWAEAIAAIADYELQTQPGYDVVTVSADTADSDDYVIKYGDDYYYDGDTIEIDAVDSNGIEETPVSFTVYEYYKDLDKTDDDNTKTLGDVVYASNVDVTASAKASVNDVKVKRTGEVSFDVIAEKAGTHKVYVKIDSFKVTFKVDANEGEAEEIVVSNVSTTPVNMDSANEYGLAGYLAFEIYDENGNEVTAGIVDDELPGAGYDNALDKDNNYVAVVEQPAKSDIENEDLYLVRGTANNAGDQVWTIAGAKFDVEGEYTFKVALDDGTSVKATIKVAEANDPVALSISYYTDSVQLGGQISPKSLGWLDANYTFTSAVVGTDVEFSATGAAVKSVDGSVITVKADEKYVGSKIEVIFVDEDNNLVVTKTLTVAAEAKELVFGTTSVPVDTTKTIGVKLVDEDGNAVGLDILGDEKIVDATASVVVLSKPADCDVTAEASAVNAKKGTYSIKFSADKVGAVTLQTVLKVIAEDADTNKNVVRYYTGTQIITVGAAGIEDIVVMSINSNEVVINGDVKTIDAAPIVENNRTFVPFRALAEAFGATVAYDEATQAVTAELNGVTVVMTIGSATYTVNDVEKTADVAPFINGSRTMVPVRFVAEAFGIKVIPTYDENGATADILFNL